MIKLLILLLFIGCSQPNNCKFTDVTFNRTYVGRYKDKACHFTDEYNRKCSVEDKGQGVKGNKYVKTCDGVEVKIWEMRYK